MSRLRVAIVIQARMGSRRLPGKVLLPLAGAPALQRMLERVARVPGIEETIVATSTEAADDEVAALARGRGVACVRGPLHDVLARTLAAAPPSCDAIVRLTGDCPLVDPELVAAHIRRLEQAWPEARYATNTVSRTMPDGLDVEVLARDLLVAADRHARSPADREHVTPWIRRRVEALAVTQPTDLSELRWTLDTAADYAFLAAVYDELWRENPRFGSDDVYRLLVRRPERIHTAQGTELPEQERRRLLARIEEHLTAESA